MADEYTVLHHSMFSCIYMMLSVQVRPGLNKHCSQFLFREKEKNTNLKYNFSETKVVVFLLVLLVRQKVYSYYFSWDGGRAKVFLAINVSDGIRMCSFLICRVSHCKRRGTFRQLASNDNGIHYHHLAPQRRDPSWCPFGDSFFVAPSCLMCYI